MSRGINQIIPSVIPDIIPHILPDYSSRTDYLSAASVGIRKMGNTGTAKTAESDGEGLGSATDWLIPFEIRNFRVIFCWFVDPTVVNTPNGGFIKASVKIVDTVYPLTFNNGETVGAIDAYGFLATDALENVTIAAGTVVEVRCFGYVESVDELIPASEYTTFGYGMARDRHRNDDTYLNESSYADEVITYSYKPMTVTGDYTSAALAKKVVVVGDSILGRTNGGYYTELPFQRAVLAPCAFLTIAASGADDTIVLNTDMVDVLKGYPKVVCAMGRNMVDTSALTVQKDRFIALWTQLKKSGAAIYQTTITPRTKSGDPWEDDFEYLETAIVMVGISIYKCIADHTSVLATDRPGDGSAWETKWIRYAPLANEQERYNVTEATRLTELNAWLRDTESTAYNHISGIIDWAQYVTAIESGMNGEDVWADGTSQDGVHPDYFTGWGLHLLGEGVREDVSQLDVTPSVYATYNTALDASLNNTDADVTGKCSAASTSISYADIEDGIGKCAVFTESPASKIIYTDADGLLSGINKTTVLMWVKMDAWQTSGRRAFAINGSATNNGSISLRLSVEANQTVIFYYGTDCVAHGSYKYISNALTLGAWSLLCATGDTSTGTWSVNLKKYGNAWPAPTSVTHDAETITDTTLKIGQDLYSQSANFQIGRTVLASRIMSDAEITMFYEQTKANYGL